VSDILNQINATHRAIGSQPVTAGEGRSLLLRRSYDAPIEDVWDACTSPGRIARWLAPVTGELRPGGSFQVEGNATGKIVRCEEPNLLKVTWEYGPDSITEVEIRLAKGPGGGTTVELEHASPAQTVDALVRSQGPVGPVGIGGGWDLALIGLDHVLHSEDFDTAAWKSTPESRQFAMCSYHAWGAVSQAAWKLSDDDISAVVEFAVEHFAPGAPESKNG
jgi:uncharacterized protein YndB with AHSA1/START domain